MTIRLVKAPIRYQSVPSECIEGIEVDGYILTSDGLGRSFIAISENSPNGVYVVWRKLHPDVYVAPHKRMTVIWD